MGRNIREHLGDRNDDGLGGHGCTGDAVDVAAISSRMPVALGERSPVKASKPVAAVAFDAITKPGRLPVRNDFYSKDLLVDIDGNEQVDGTCIAVWCAYSEHPAQQIAVIAVD